MCKYVTMFFLVVSAGLMLSGCGSGDKDVRGAASILVSTDGGASFAPRTAMADDKSMADVTVLSMVRDHQDAQTMYIGTQKNGIFVTRSGGEQWEHIVFPPQKVYGVAVDRDDPRVLYASGVHNSFGKIFKSVDGGDNWDEIYTEPTKNAVITALAMDPANARTLYVGTSTGVIIKTSDGGASWENIYTARARPVTRIVFDAQDAQTVYFALYEKGLLKSRDGGATIEDFTKKIIGDTKRTSSGLSSGSSRRSTRVYSLETDPRTPGVVYIGTEKGVYRSEDYGVNWAELKVIGSSDKLPVKVIAINPHNPQELTYSVARTLYRSSKNMTEWTPVQISGSRIASVIQYDPVSEGTIYVGLMKSKK